MRLVSIKITGTLCACLCISGLYNKKVLWSNSTSLHYCFSHKKSGKQSWITSSLGKLGMPNNIHLGFSQKKTKPKNPKPVVFVCKFMKRGWCDIWCEWKVCPLFVNHMFVLSFLISLIPLFLFLAFNIFHPTPGQQIWKRVVVSVFSTATICQWLAGFL